MHHIGKPVTFPGKKSLISTHCREKRKPTRETVDFDMEIKHFGRQTTLDLLSILRGTISYARLFVVSSHISQSSDHHGDVCMGPRLSSPTCITLALQTENPVQVGNPHSDKSISARYTYRLHSIVSFITRDIHASAQRVRISYR
jgi:hypothetical protein